MSVFPARGLACLLNSRSRRWSLAPSVIQRGVDLDQGYNFLSLNSKAYVWKDNGSFMPFKSMNVFSPPNCEVELTRNLAYLEFIDNKKQFKNYPDSFLESFAKEDNFSASSISTLSLKSSNSFHSLESIFFEGTRSNVELFCAKCTESKRETVYKYADDIVDCLIQYGFQEASIRFDQRLINGIVENLTVILYGTPAPSSMISQKSASILAEELYLKIIKQFDDTSIGTNSLITPSHLKSSTSQFMTDDLSSAKDSPVSLGSISCNVAYSRLTERSSEILNNEQIRAEDLDLLLKLEQYNHKIILDPKAIVLEGNMSYVMLKEPEIVDWDYWGHLLGGNPDFTKGREGRKTFIQQMKSGIPNELRGPCWVILCNADESLEVDYHNFLEKSSTYDKMIRRDVSRTFPKHPFFDATGQEQLFNIVKSFVIYDRQIGYTQGMSFIAGILLLTMPEEQSFAVFCTLMNNYKLREMFLPGFDNLQRNLFVLECLIQKESPKLARHLLELGITADMYACQWFLTLFAYKFPLDYVLRIFDIILSEGIDVIYSIAVNLMKRSAKVLLKMKFEEAVTFLKEELHTVVPITELIELCLAGKCFTSDIRKFEKAFRPTEQDLLHKILTLETELSNYRSRLAEAELKAQNAELEYIDREAILIARCAKLNERHDKLYEKYHNYKRHSENEKMILLQKNLDLENLIKQQRCSTCGE